MTADDASILLDGIDLFAAALHLALAAPQVLDLDQHAGGIAQALNLRRRSMRPLQLIQQPGRRLPGHTRQVARSGAKSEAIGGNYGFFHRHAGILGAKCSSTALRLQRGLFRMVDSAGHCDDRFLSATFIPGYH